MIYKQCCFCNTRKEVTDNNERELIKDKKLEVKRGKAAYICAECSDKIYGEYIRESERRFWEKYGE